MEMGSLLHVPSMIEPSRISPVLPGKFPALEISPPGGASSIQDTSFSDLLNEAVSRIEALSAESDRLAIDTALGRPVELHQVMLAATKAQVAMELLIEVRNRLIEAYQEISRMPV
jgi:flagellar hook-basal body complex protein FliE